MWFIMYTRFHTSIDVRPVTPSVYQGEQLRCSPPTYRLQNWYTNTVCMFWCLIFIEFFLYVNHISYLLAYGTDSQYMYEQGKIHEVGKRIPHKSIPEPMRTIHFKGEEGVIKKIVLPNIYWKTIKVIAGNFDERKNIRQALCPQLKEVLSILNSIY